MKKFKVRLKYFKNEIENLKNISDFEELCNEKGIPFRKCDYGVKELIIYRFDDLTVDGYNVISNYDGTLSISEMPVIFND